MKLKLKLASDARNTKKGFYGCVNQKRRDKEDVPPLINKAGKLVMTDEEKADVLNNIFVSFFEGNISSHTS